MRCDSGSVTLKRICGGFALKIINRKPVSLAQSCLAAVFILALSGCVSAVPEQKDASATPTPAANSALVAGPANAQGNVAQQGAVGGYVDPAMVSATSRSASPVQSNQPVMAQQAQVADPVYGQAPQISGLSTQPTGISASSLSIYANSAPGMVNAVPGASASTAQPAAAPTSIPAYAPLPKVSPALNSVYSAPAAVQPMPAAPAPSGQQHSATTVPMNAAETTQALAALGGSPKGTVPGEQTGVPAAAFLAGLPKKRGSGAVGGTQVAALPLSATARQGMVLPGRTSMTDEFDDTHTGDDNKPAGLMKLASLSGLSRVAPNGLLLQTQDVNVGCFKPEMIRRIKEVEAHFGRPAMVTSGYRPAKSTTQGSKHYTCDAADIQVNGVSRWELANYLRSIPDRGGVGTYCHTESVHMDLGEPRDWNWRCRRTQSSL
ncbi:DUF882 domain-containing protein [Rhizobium skierniewicense]|nr:DUF882 domain-containing protein [Rhizobium skierniewicense]